MAININHLTIEQLKLLQKDIVDVLASAAAAELAEQELLKANEIRVKLHELSEIRKKIQGLAKDAANIIDMNPDLGGFSINFGDISHTYDSDNGWSNSY